MAAEVRLRCDAVIDGVRCDAEVDIAASSAVIARDDATGYGWVNRRSTRGHSRDVRDFCPRCAPIFVGRKVRI